MYCQNNDMYIDKGSIKMAHINYGGDSMLKSYLLENYGYNEPIF